MKILREFKSKIESLFVDILSQEPLFTNLDCIEDGNKEKKTYILVIPYIVLKNTFQNL